MALEGVVGSIAGFIFGAFFVLWGVVVAVLIARDALTHPVEEPDSPEVTAPNASRTRRVTVALGLAAFAPSPSGS
jgi:hypothetical protein